MSLPLRLMLAFLALASLVAIVAVTSFTSSQRLGSDVAELNRQDVIDLRHVDLAASWLEIEGFWDPAGRFIANHVEIHPGHRYPSLRGAVQAIDPEQRTVTLYGTPIAIRDLTVFVEPGPLRRFEDFAIGQRVEIDSEVEAGVWIAKEVESFEIKKSDKLKATVTGEELDGRPPETIEIHGLAVELQSSTDHAPESAVGRIETAARMAVALQECHALAYALVGATRRATEPVPPEAEPALAAPAAWGPGEPADPRARLEQACAKFDYHLDRAQLADSSSNAKRNLARLNERRAELRASIEKLVQLEEGSRREASAVLDAETSPLIQDELIPLVNEYLSYAQQALEAQLSWIVDGSHWTTQLALLIGIAAALAALIVAALVWRSITVPVRTLHAAALRIGEGHLDTRVALESRDEIGVLARAFNTMASELEASTLSVDKLQSVFDSMAAALILLSPQGRVMNANAAAGRMLHYAQAELLAASYDQICSETRTLETQSRDPGDTGLASALLAGSERLFIRKDGSRFPVSFSATELRSGPEAPLRGYVCVAQDLSLLKHIEGQLRGSLAEKELLLREVHHRVKNNLQIICSMLALQSGEILDVEAREHFEQTESRIRSMALIHDQLYESAGSGAIPMRVYLERLASELARSLQQSGEVGLRVDVDEIELDVDRSLACGLIVSELATRSIKRSLAAGTQRQVEIRLARSGLRECELEIRDGSAAPDPLEVGSAGGAFAGNLVEALVRQLHGTLKLDADGRSQAQIRFPIDRPREEPA